MELEAEIIASMGEDTRVAMAREVELNAVGSQAISSENFRSYNEAVAHSKNQDFNRSKFSQADGAALKQ